jgi:hypothetical protein
MHVRHRKARTSERDVAFSKTSLAPDPAAGLIM